MSQLLRKRTDGASNAQVVGKTVPDTPSMAFSRPAAPDRTRRVEARNKAVG
jgi:hypothetical protein